MAARSLRLCFLQDRLRLGGTERQTVFLATALARRGHTVEVLLFRPGGTLPAGPDGLAVRVLQPFDTGLDWLAPGLLWRLRAFWPHATIAMGRTANSLLPLLPHELTGARVATLRSGRPLTWLHRTAVRRADAVVANSYFAAFDGGRQAGRPLATIAVVPNPLLLDPAAVGTRPPHARPVRLLCVAGFRPVKNHAGLLRALAALRDIRVAWTLTLVGDGPERAPCERLAAELGLAPRTVFAGAVADPTPHLRDADIAVLASSHESLPNFLVEAQSFGLPVVATDAGGAQECFLPRTSGLLVPVGDTRAFAAAVASLLDDDARRRRFGEAGRAWARTQFDPARILPVWEDVLARTVDARR